MLKHKLVFIETVDPGLILVTLGFLSYGPLVQALVPSSGDADVNGQSRGTQDVVATTYALNLYRQAPTVADAGLLSGRYERTVLSEVAVQESTGLGCQEATSPATGH